MRFDNFISSLTLDIRASKNLRLEKRKDANGRLLLLVFCGNNLLTEIGYTTNGYGTVSRYAILWNNGIKKTTLGPSGQVMASHIVSWLSGYASMRNSIGTLERS